jgi:hypothetical protein
MTTSNINFNKTTISPDCKNMYSEFINTYNEIKPATKSKLLNYFIEYKLKNLMEVIEEF